MREFDNVLRRATESIPATYINFPIDAGENRLTIYRERVYCYELYHQMRCGWDAVCEGFTLNGEVDKSGHALLRRRRITGGIPDLLVHRPGPDGMNHNYAMIEVKSPTARDEKIVTDLKKLNAFVRRAGYTRGIFLVYASGADRDQEWIDRLTEIIAAEAEVVSAIELWLHRAPNAAADLVRHFPAKPV
jgi:hypothetical protein